MTQWVRADIFRGGGFPYYHTPNYHTPEAPLAHVKFVADQAAYDCAINAAQSLDMARGAVQGRMAALRLSKINKLPAFKVDKILGQKRWSWALASRSYHTSSGKRVHKSKRAVIFPASGFSGRSRNRVAVSFCG